MNMSTHSAANQADANLNQMSSDSSFEGSYVCEFNSSSRKWECQQFYKTQILQTIIDQHDNQDGRQTIDQLKEFGITVYLAEHDTVNIALLKQVISHVTVNRNDRSREPHENQRCILYRDKSGQLYNLTVDNGSGGLASTWKSLLLSFSGLQAMVAMSVLTRAFACMNPESKVKPGYFLGLVLGLVLFEEMSQSFLNVALLVQGVPSVAAYSLSSGSDSDWPRKLAVFALALAAAQEAGSAAQKICTLLGIALSMALLAANLGSRAWLYMRWKPIGNMFGALTPFYAYCAAILTGLVFPFMGFRQIQSGGAPAIQTIMINCAIVAILFVLSDLNVVQGFIFMGQACDQTTTNIVLGSWLAMAAVSSIFAARKIEKPETVENVEGEIDMILDEDQTSPVGYKVPNFPDYCIDPVRFREDGLSCFSTNVQTFLGIVICLGLGAFVGSAALVDYFKFE
mmetsp:Transcript_15381/g.26265  ORF Transcript_15381/g.26265 Transcript_15381/m.26265 type:complete len:455 (+) Transcript_15381:144-1508(+)